MEPSEDWRSAEVSNPMPVGTSRLATAPGTPVRLTLLVDDYAWPVALGFGHEVVQLRHLLAKPDHVILTDAANAGIRKV